MEAITERKVVYVGQGSSTLRTDKDFEVALTPVDAKEEAMTRCCLLTITLLPGVRVQTTPDGLRVEGGGIYTETNRTETTLPWSKDIRGGILTGIAKRPTFLTIEATYGPKVGGRRRWKMPRKMTRRYCKKTACKRMGFTQRASCRPWKKC